MKISFNKKEELSNTYSKTKSLEVTRSFADIIKLEGIQGGNVIEAKGTVKNLTYLTTGSKKINLKGNVEIKTREYAQKNSSNNIKLKWDKTLPTIPELQKNIPLNSLLKIPENMPDIKQVKSIKPTIKEIKATTLTNRVVIKGDINFEIEYNGL